MNACRSPKWFALFVPLLGLLLSAGCLPEWDDADDQAGEPVDVVVEEPADVDDGTGGNDADPAPDPDPVVPPAVPGDPPTLTVLPAELYLDLAAPAQPLEFHYSGPEPVSFTVAASTAWLAAWPAEGTIAPGATGMVSVSAELRALRSGEYLGTLTVSAGALTREVPVRAAVAPAGLALDQDELVFGPGERRQHFTLRNTGGDALPFTLTTDVPWLSVEPPAGELGSTAEMEITVDVERTLLWIGEQQGNVAVQAGNGHSAAVLVRAQKNVTSPRVIPWLDLYIYDPAQVEVCRQGLDLWSRVTDTVIIQGGRDRIFYANLVADYPHLEIIPSHLTRYMLQLPNQFHSAAGWAQVAEDTLLNAAACGTTRAVLDHEWALTGYGDGTYDIDMEQLSAALQAVAPDLQALDEIIWYPAVYAKSTSWPLPFERSALLCATVNAALPNVRFVDLSYGASEWWVPAWVATREYLDGLANNPTLPIVWFGCTETPFCYWFTEDFPEAMDAVAGRSEVTFYPVHGVAEWVSLAEELLPYFDALDQ